MSEPSSLPYYLAQLEKLCTDRPLASKLVFVPSLQIGYNLGTALSLAGVPWVNLHLTTTAAWAERLAGAELRAAGRRPLVQDADHFFMLETIRGVSWPAGHPFARGYSAGGLAATFLRTVRGLRLAGIAPDELAGAKLALGGRRIFIDVYRAYCDWLKAEGLFDRADLYRAATRPEPDVQVEVAVFDETPLPETAFRFVRSLSGRLRRIGRSDYGSPAPQHSARERFEDAPLVGGGRVGPAGFVRPGGVDASACAGIRLREAVGIESEVRGALRELLREDVRLDQIELVYTAEDPYLPLLVDVMERLQLPASYAAGVPVTLTSTGQALLGFYRWIASGLDPDLLVQLLRSRLLFVAQRRDAPDLELWEAAEALREARVGPGRTAWRGALRRFLERLSGSADAAASGRRRAYLDRRAAVVRRLTAWMDELYAIVPGRETASLAEVAEAGVAFLGRFAPKTGTERDNRAAESLTDRLAELADCASSAGRLSDLACSMADLMGEHKVEAAVARPDHVYVVPLERAGYAGREHTVVLGLSEATFPGAPTEDPILLDHERERIPGGRLIRHRVRVSEPIWHLVRALGAAASGVLMTANRRDLSEGRETYPSAVFEQLKEQLGLEHPPVYRVVPDAADVLTADEVALAVRGRATAAIVEGHPWLAGGLTAVRARAQAKLGRYDGWIGRRTPELRPSEDALLSASRLEDLAACPYRYFLRNVLKVRPPDLPEDLPGRWLTPLEFGSVLHEVLHAFMESVSGRDERVDADRHAGLMSDVIDEAVARVRERIPVRQEAGYRVDVRRLRRAAHVFLTEESRRDVRPAGFEVTFGMGRDEGLAVPHPVSLRLSDDVGLSLSGAIDRVDEADDGFEVWDYKSGSGSPYDESDMLSSGRRLQWALYAHVLDDLLERAGWSGRTVRSGYFFAGDREHGLRLSGEPPSREALGETLAPLFDLVEQGAFLHVQKRRECTFCDYRSVCAAERKGPRELEDALPASRGAPFVSPLEAWMEV